MVFGRLLKGVRESEQGFFAEVRPDQLRAYRQIAHEPGRQRQRGEPGKARRDREDVLEIHGHRIGRVLADLERRRGRDRREDRVHRVEGGEELVAYEAPDALRRSVVGIVVADGERVGARQDASFHLFAETLGARATVEVCQVRRVLTAMAETNSVEAREVRGCLCGGDDVVGGDTAERCVEINLDAASAERLVLASHRIERPGHLRGQIGEQSGRNAEGPPGDRGVQRRAVIRDRYLCRGRVALVEAGDGLQEQGCIFRCMGEGAGLVER